MARKPRRSTTFQGCQTGLILFGVLELLLGFGFGLLAVFIPGMGSKVPDFPPKFFLMGLAFFLFLSALWITLGFGSLFARRWARALTLMASWFWLLAGLAATLVSLKAVFFPTDAERDLYQTLSPGTLLVIHLTVIGFFAVLGILLPAILIYFYSRPNVKATCETKDPGEGWTDRVPLPVLGLSLLSALQAVLMLPVLALLNFTGVFFGWVVSGLPGLMLMSLLTALNAYLAWGFYRLQRRVWRIGLVYYLLMGLSMFLNTPDKMIEVCLRQGLPMDEIARMSQAGSLSRAGLSGAIVMFLWAGYLFCLRKYFPAVPPGPLKKAARKVARRRVARRK